MNATETKLLGKLKELDQAVGDIRRGAAKPDLMAIFSELDRLTLELPKNADPELVHFLHKKSYEKAKALLEGLSSRNQRGPCRDS